MAQITRVTSEALQATIRRLLPSQQGFGEDLEASNVITPVIDLTPTAEGSALPSYLQTALAFGSVTSFDVANTTSELITTTGFWRIVGTATVRNVSSGGTQNRIEFFFRDTDGGVSKVFYGIEGGTASTNSLTSVSFDFNVFLASNIQVRCKVEGTDANTIGSVRQIASINGDLVDPSGYTSQ